jgi:hypothetical protein
MAVRRGLLNDLKGGHLRLSEAFGIVAPIVVLLTAAPRAPLAPSFRVDPFWPKPLPNKWLVGAVVGVAVDRRDHIWIVHRT